MNEFVCENIKCRKKFFQDDDYTKWNHWCRCDECGFKAFWVDRPPRMVMTKFIKGYTGGYNEGLGVEIRSKEHYKQVCKEKGCEPL